MASLDELISHPDGEAYFKIRGLNIPSARRFFRVLIDITHSDHVDLPTFVSACVKLDGTASSIDMHVLLVEMRSVQMSLHNLDRQLRSLDGHSTSNVQEVSKAMSALHATMLTNSPSKAESVSVSNGAPSRPNLETQVSPRSVNQAQTQTQSCGEFDVILTPRREDRPVPYETKTLPPKRSDPQPPSQPQAVLSTNLVWDTPMQPVPGPVTPIMSRSAEETAMRPVPEPPSHPLWTTISREVSFSERGMSREESRVSEAAVMQNTMSREMSVVTYHPV